MKKVYIVTSGEYSDYGINAVFSTKEKAQEYIDMFSELKSGYDKGVIEEFDIDIIDDKKGLKPYSVRVTKDGLIAEWNISENDFCFNDPNHGVGIDFDGNMYVYIFARNKEEARKSAIDISRQNYNMYR